MMCGNMTTDLGIYRDAVSTVNTLIIMEKGNLIEKQQICLDANSAASRSKFLHFKSVLTILALCLCMVLGGEAWGQASLTWSSSDNPIDNSTSVSITCGTTYTVTAETKKSATVTFIPSNASCSLKINCSASDLQGSSNRDEITLSGGGSSPSYTNNSDPLWQNAGDYTTNAGSNLVVAFSRNSKGKNNSTFRFTIECFCPTTYTVTYNSNGGSGTMTDSNSPYASGSTVTTLANSFTPPTGMAFAGWNTAANGSGASYAADATFTITSDVTLYAQWVASYTYNITYDANGGTGTMSPNPQTGSGSSVTLTANTFTNAGKTFTGWNTAANGSGNSYSDGQTISLTGNLTTTLFAQWATISCMTEDFSGYTAADYDASTYQQPAGWTCSTGGSYPPRISSYSALYSSYQISGMETQGNFLYMVGSSNYSVMPMYALVSLSFKYACESGSYGTLQVGYVTNLADVSGTFTSLRTLTTTTTLTAVTLTSSEISTITAANGYVAFYWNYSSNYGVGIDDIEVCESCTDPNISILGCPASSMLVDATATLTATRLGSGAVTWTSSDDDVATVVGGVVTAVGEGSATITATVAANGVYCSRSATCSVTVTDGCPTIGDGTSYYDYYTPIYSYSSGYYSYTQQIYPASEILAAGGVAGKIERIKFQYYGSSNLTIPINVYLGQTSQTSLSSAWISDASLTQVYSGSVTFTSGWVELDISAANYMWDGTSNILLAVKTTGTPSSSYYYFYYTSVTGGARYATNYSSQIDLSGTTNVPSSATGTSSSYRPNVRFCIDACTDPSGDLTLSSTSGSVLVGNTIDLGAGHGILSNSISGTVTYSSSDDGIASVTSAGVVTGVSEGIATIKATISPSGYCPKTVTYTVTVTDGCDRIGFGTSTIGYAPLMGNYKMSYDQMIYTAAEIGGTGTINSIAFYSSATNSVQRTVKVYIGMTDKSLFSSSTDFIPVSSLTQVWGGAAGGAWDIDEGWNTFTITGGFEYNDPDKNIVVAFYSTADNYSSSSFYYTSTADVMTIYAYSDSDDPDPASNDADWSSYSGYNYTTTSRPNLKFCMERCTPPTGTFAYSTTFNSINVSATLDCAISPAGLTPSAGTVTYSSSNTSVATVTNAGSVTGVAAGVAVITATFTPTDDSYCPVTTSRTVNVGCSYSAPVCFDFEDYATPNTNYYQDAGMPQCWSRIYSGTYTGGEPHAYNGYIAKDGNGIVITSGVYDEYDENFGFTNYVVMPYISGLAAGDKVSFNAWWQYLDRGELTLGYLTNPADASTFTPIDDATSFLYSFGSANAGLNQITLPAIPTGAFLAFRWYYPNNYYSYSVVIDNICICHPPAGTFELTTTSGTVVAMNTLDIHGYINNTIDQSTIPGEIIYSSANTDVATVSSAGVITGIAEGEVEIIVTYTPDNSDYCPVTAVFTVTVNDGCTKVGDGGSNTTYYAPVNTWYNYTYTQIIYDNTELSAGLITAIGFEYAYSTAMTAKNSVNIYMMETDKTAFSGTSDWVTDVADEGTLVYSGDLNCSEGWNTFNLDEPFVYDGTHNLLLVIDDNSGSYNGSSYVFNYTTTDGYSMLNYYNDTYNYDNDDISGKSGTRYEYRPNTKFCIYSGALHSITYNTTTNCTGGVASTVESSYGVEGHSALVSSDEPTCSTGMFLEWNTSANGDGTSYSPGDVIAIGSTDITLYAIYRICDYISVSRNGQPAQGVGDGGYDSEGIQKFNVCLGSDLALIANTKDTKPADVTITSYKWEVNKHNGDAPLTSTNSTVSYTADNAMGHDILLIVDASDGCHEEMPLRVWVSDGLEMAGDAPTAGSICVGAGKEIAVGDPAVVPESIIEVDNEAIEIKSSKGAAVRKFIPDGVGECYTSTVTFADFKESTVITDASNIDYVRINLEHSFIADMQISLKCYTPELEERTAILLQDKYDISDGGLDNATYTWPYIYICCKAKYNRYYNTGYSSGECTQGTYKDQVNKVIYVKYDGSTYSATGVRIEATAFDESLTTSEKLVHLKGMINSGNTPPAFCDGEYYYTFSDWLYDDASHYTTSNYSSSPSSSEWYGGYVASLGFGKPNALDGFDDYVTDLDYNPYGEGLDYCWSNNDSYSYADGSGTVIETVNHMDGYTNGKIVKPSNVEAGTQFYHPYQSFQSLVGCKLNGLWTIQICDSWELDNGYIFSWEIGLKDVDDNAWSYDVTLVDSHVGTCGGYDSEDPYNTENLIYEVENSPNFYIHPTLQNIGPNNVTMGAVRNCELTLIDNIGCESTGQGFTYTVVQPTVPSITDPVICIGEETTVSGSLSAGAVTGAESLFRWWRRYNGTNTQLSEETGVTSSSITIRPNAADSVYSVEIYDAEGCGGIVDDVVTINSPDESLASSYDYIWKGGASGHLTDWNTSANWYVYDNGYSLATATLPDVTKNVYIGDTECAANNTPQLDSDAGAKNLTIVSAASLTVPASKTLNIAGNLDNSGTLSLDNASTVVFCGPSSNGGDQTISNNITLGNVTFNNQGGDIVPAGSMTINGAATFTKGIVDGDVTFGSSASATANSYASYVDGTVTKTGSANGFTFPTGNNGVLGKVAATSDVSGVTVRYLNNPAGFGLDVYPRWWNINDMCSGNDPQFDHVSNFEYWDIGTTGVLSATLTVSSVDSSAHFNSVSPTHNGGDVYGAFWNGNCWENIGGANHSVSDDPYGTISVDITIPEATRAYSKIVSLGSQNHSTVLPIELTALTATCDGRKALVEWTTASERNNDYFSLERSDDAINFTEIARIAGAGNSIAPLDYSYTDYGVHGGDNYYRLVQVDYDGTRTASEIVVANCIEASGKPEVLAYPNPFNGELTVELENFSNRPARIDVYDMLGRLVYTEEVGAPQNSYQTVLHFGNLPDATYTVRVGTADFVINRKVVKQQ